MGAVASTFQKLAFSNAKSLSNTVKLDSFGSLKHETPFWRSLGHYFVAIYRPCNTNSIFKKLGLHT